MKTSSMLLAITMNLVVGIAAMSQIADWRTLIRDAASPDPAVVDAVRERVFKILSPQLDAADPKSLDKDIAAILEAFSDAEPVRLQASALLAGLAMSRRDGSESLKRAIPVFLAQFGDQNQRVRENAIRAIASLRPQIPSEAFAPLLTVVRDNDLPIARAAIYGVARFAKTSPVAVNELASLLSGDHPVRIRHSVIQSIGQERLDNPLLIARLGEILGGKDHDLVKETINAVAMIGPPAAALKPILQRIADIDADEELSSAAAAAVSRLQR